MQKKAQLVDGHIAKTLLNMTIAMFFGVLSMVAFNLVDTFFVGKLGTKELAAMSFTFPIVMIIGSIANGIGIGTSALVSRAIGSNNQHTVKRLTTDALLLAVVCALIFASIGLVTIEPLFRLLGATPDIVPLIKEYMQYWYLGVPFIFIPMTGNSIIRATGDTKTPSIIMLVVVVVNGILDPILIFGFGFIPPMELKGAAIATVCARFITLVVALWVLTKREKMLTFVLPTQAMVLASWRQILHIGLPTAITNAIIPFTIGIITRLVATYGSEAVAGFGVASRIDIFAMMIFIALAASLAPFVGQNWGAGKRERVFLAIRYSQQFVFGWGIMMFVVLFFLSRPIAMVFNDHNRVVEVIVRYLSIVSLSYGFQGFIGVASSVLNVMQKPLHAAGITFVQMFVLLIPMAYIGSAYVGIEGIFLALVIAHGIMGIVSLGVLRRTLEGINWNKHTTPAVTPHAPAESASSG